MALNAGDLLLGDGYRLLAGCDAPPAVVADLVRIASSGHRELCLGQGTELAWMQNPAAVSADQVIEIFRRKTAPAFQVALGIGAALAGASAETQDVLRDKGALVIAYQIRAKISKMDQSGPRRRVRCAYAVGRACYKARAPAATDMTLWRGGRTNAADRDAFRALLGELDIESRARALLEAYKEQAIRTLPALQNASLKGLLRRVIGKVFRVEIKGWCSEFAARDAAGRQAGAPAAG